MKIRFCAAMLLAALSITILTGCAASSATPSAKAAADSVQSGQSSSSTPAQPAPTPAAAPTVSPATVPAPAPTQPATAGANLITREEAIAIALQDAGFTEDQVTRLRTEFDRDDRRPEYEVDFHQGGYEYDYEIHAETGAILSKDIDRED